MLTETEAGQAERGVGSLLVYLRYAMRCGVMQRGVSICLPMFLRVCISVGGRSVDGWMAHDGCGRFL